MAFKHPKVLVTRSDFPEVGINMLKERCEVEIFCSEKGNITTKELIEKMTGIDALFITGVNKMDKNILRCAGLSGVKVIATMSAGLDHIDLEEAKKSSIRIGYITIPNGPAELTVAILLAVSRRIVEGYNKIVRGEWNTNSRTWMCGKGLRNSTVGFFGFGRIGQSVANKLLTFEISRILYTGRSKKMEADRFGAEFVNFETLLKESDFVIVTCPLNAETRGIFTIDKFSLMKPSAIFINTSRGGIVDQDALVYALQNKIIAGAALDVMTPEPLPPDHPLLKLDNCVLTPHVGSATQQFRDEMSILTARNILTALDGKEMPSEYIQ